MIAILGAGHAGRAMAGDLALRGAPVALWNRTAANIAVLRSRGGVELAGEVEGFGRLGLVSDDLEQVLRGSRLVIVCVPAFAHREVAERCAPFLCDEQVVVLNPGRTFGALEFRRALAASECSAFYRPRPVVSRPHQTRGAGGRDSRRPNARGGGGSL
jgi:opine dehydrogenase